MYAFMASGSLKSFSFIFLEILMVEGLLEEAIKVESRELEVLKREFKFENESEKMW